MTSKEAIQEIINLANNLQIIPSTSTGQAVLMAIEALKQEEKTGKWIPLGNYDEWGNENSYKCSECGERNFYPDNYCPNCGARMIEPQESEDKNADSN